MHASKTFFTSFNDHVGLFTVFNLLVKKFANFYVTSISKATTCFTTAIF